MVVFQIWFDGVTALGAMLAFQMRAFARRGDKVFEAPLVFRLAFNLEYWPWSG
jgi:hypothetical protein